MQFIRLFKAYGDQGEREGRVFGREEPDQFFRIAQEVPELMLSDFALLEVFLDFLY